MPTEAAGSGTAPRFRARFALVLLLPVAVAAAGAERVYRWTDSDGRVHFSDRPGAADAEPLEVDPVAPVGAVDPGRRRRTERLLEVLELERAEREAARVEAEREAADRARRCAAAEKEYERVTTARYLYAEDAAGERVILDAPARRAYETEAAQAVKKWCSSDR